MNYVAQSFPDVVVVSAVRTPLSALGGALKDVLPEELLRVVIKEAIERAGISNGEVNEVICGQAKQSSDAPNIARVAALMAGMPESVTGYTVHRQCGSGMQAILDGVMQIRAGISECVLTGGVESMSTAPFYLRGIRFGVGNGNQVLADPNTESQPKSQPEEIYGTFGMIETADNVARRYKVSRFAQDEFAFDSQQRAIKAIDSGIYKEEIISVMVPGPKKTIAEFAVDDFPKRSTTMEKLSKLPTVFANGFVTAGNATGRNDGAAMLLLMSAQKAKELGVVPLAKIIDGAAAGTDPRYMGIGPVYSTQKLLLNLKKRGVDIKLSDFGLVEINEAFAAQSVACINELGLDAEKVNVNGGAIALGHPLGCTGARISVTLLHEMKKRGVSLGLSSLCIAGGMGMSMAFEQI